MRRLDDELFPVGLPAREGHVVDREAFIGDTVERLQDRVSLVLAAPRRVGKTSVSFEILRRARRRGLLTLRVDLAGLVDIADFADRLAFEALKSHSGAGKVASALGAGLRHLLDHPEIRVVLHDLEIAATFGDWERQSPWQKLDAALALPDLLAAREKRGAIVVFDEFQDVFDLGGRLLLARLRSAFQVQTRTSFLFLGSRGTLLRRLFEHKNQPFFRYALIRDMPRVQDEAWATYITARLATRRMGITSDGLRTLLETTGGHPYDLMEVADQSYRVALTLGTEITGNTVRTAVDDVLHHLGSVFEGELDALGGKSRLVLTRIAQGARLYPAGSSQAAVRHALVELLRNGVIEKGARRRYQLTEPMLGTYLRGRSAS